MNFHSILGTISCSLQRIDTLIKCECVCHQRFEINVSRLKKSYGIRPGMMVAVNELEINLERTMSVVVRRSVGDCTNIPLQVTYA